MRALETLAICAVPFMVLGWTARWLLRRHTVDLTDVQAQAGVKRSARRVFLLGSWRNEE